MAFDPRTPFEGLPPLPPSTDVETKRVLRLALRATRALAELKRIGGLIPDQPILINAIPLQKAKLSSEIENIVTTQDELFRAALDEVHVTDPQTKEVLRYRTTCKELIELIFRQPYCKIAFLVEAGIAKRKTASVYLQELERIGILTSEKRGREVIYKHPALLEVLTS